jgi:PmbA protein
MTQTAPDPRSTQTAPDPEALKNLAEDIVRDALKAGADAAEAGLAESRSLEASIRNGALEDLERSESRDAGLRVFVGKRQAGVAFSDLSTQGRKLAIERAVAMAKAAPEDPYCGLVEREALAGKLPDIPLYEAGEWDPAILENLGFAMEDAALKIDEVETITQAGAGFGAGAGALVTSNGFAAGRRGSTFSLGIAPLAKRGSVMERDFYGHSARRFGELKSPEEIGRIAGERAAARLGSTKIKGGKMPVVFDSRVATTFVSSLLGAISGPAVARGNSFLKSKMGERVFAEGIDIVEDPLKAWGHGSRAFDGEGVAVRARALVEDGVLTTWLLNASSARQLGLPLTGHAAQGLGSPPGVRTSNVHLAAGERSRDDLIADAGTGLLVTEMFGPSLNENTGDWSVGVAGFAIVDGKIAAPVSEMTVAGNLIEIFARLEPGSDLEFDHATNSPSILVDALSVGGL